VGTPKNSSPTRYKEVNMINYTPSTDHTGLFYSSKEEYLNVVVPYLKAGLENNEFCLWIVPEILKVKDAEMYLRSSVEDLNSYINKEQIVIKDHKSFYLKDGLFIVYKTIESLAELEEKILQKGFKGIRITGDGSWALGGCWASFLKYEQYVNSTIDTYKVKALCSYSITKLNLKNIHEVGINHRSSLVKRMGNWDRIDSAQFKKAGAS
jgi:hypothetical protein